MAKGRKNSGRGKILALIIVWSVYLLVLIGVLLRGQNVALFNPKGMIAQEQLNLGLWTVGIMLIIGIPALFLFYFVAWKYRESNPKAKRDANAGHGKWLNVAIWGAPTVIMLTMAPIMWADTHRLEPQKKIDANAKHLTIQVVALRWKWLFIYPEQKIATVNYVQVPKNTPVTFQLTGDEAPMSAFWIPNWGGMLYAMNGHVNSLNLVANEEGEFPGSTAEINGAGFAGMKFTAKATAKDSFDFWAQEISMSAPRLDAAAYDNLLKPSENHPFTTYSLPDNDLYAKVVMKYTGSHEGHSTAPAPKEHGAHH